MADLGVGQLASSAFGGSFFSGLGITSALIIVVGSIFFAIVLAISIGVFLWWRKYRLKITFWRIVNGKMTIIGRNRGWLRKIGTAGDYWLVTLKEKDILPRPSIYIGRLEVWYFIREDGEAINIGMEDVDLKMKNASVKYIDQDMRLGRIAIQKALRDEFKKQTFWDKYGHWIITFIFLVIVVVLLILLTYRIEKIIDYALLAQSTAAEIAKELVNLQRSIGCGGAVPVN